MKNPTYKTSASRNNRTNVKAIIVIALVIAVFLIVGHIESHYNMTAIVTYINSNDYVTVVDAEGDVWAFYGTNFSVGDEVKLKMFTNCTDSIYDDEVVKAVKV